VTGAAAAAGVEAAAVEAAAVAAVGAGATDPDVGDEQGAPVTPAHQPAVDTAIESTTLPGGLRVITERMPHATSVSAGFYARIGSRDESDERAGSSHFLEHLLFKGTEARSARSISMAIDAVGGEVNAFTTREHTAYYCRLPVPKLRFGLDLLADVVTEPAFRPNEVDAERDVILDELMMAEDTPDDVLHMRLMEALFPDHPLGRETLGTETSIEGLTRDQIAEFHAAHYRPANLVVAAAGDLTHEQVLEAVADRFGSGPPPPARHRVRPAGTPEPVVVVHRPIEQAHIAFGWQALHHDDPDRYAFHVANQVLGGSVSSRLFQAIREERGLVYTVYSSMSWYTDTGVATMYAATAPRHLAEVVERMDAILDELLADGITDEEHEVAVGCIEGSLLLGLEDTGSRMGRLGGSLMNRDEVVPVDVHLGRIRAVTGDDVSRVLHRIFAGPRTVAAVGPFGPDEPTIAAAVERRR
jgi:predicted Zn-dependent peptidase